MKKDLRFKIYDLRSQKGFTLIELLIVIVIIGVLATLLMTNFVGVRQRGRDAQRKSDLRQIQAALELYRADQGSYPLTANFPACNASFVKDTNTYMQKVPCDPTGIAPFVYKYSSDGTTYSIFVCLENVNDSQRDIPSVSPCDLDSATNKTNTSFTLQNP